MYVKTDLRGMVVRKGGRLRDSKSCFMLKFTFSAAEPWDYITRIDKRQKKIELSLCLIN
jgi:hypothetical protein